MSHHHHYVHLGNELRDRTFKFTFEKPPDELAPGESVELDVTATVSGTVVSGTALGQFKYQAVGGRLTDEGYLRLDNESEGGSATATFVAPKTSSRGLSIEAILLGCRGCVVTWVYEERTEVAD